MILGLAAFLRIYRLDELMPFIGDQALFYLPARDILIEGVIPLVGPETSHPWIHHGAIWTYVLAIILWVFKFNPVLPAYSIAILGVATVWLLYKVSSELFTKRVGLITAFLFATSPLIVLNARMPYHTSPIPFFTVLLFFAVYRWIKGGAYYFPLITFLMGVLYNHELTTFVLFIPIIIFLFYGFFKKERWVKKILNKKIITYSVLSFLVPMIPFILYDISNGYKQTVGFIAWVFYRIIKFPLSFTATTNLPSGFPEFVEYLKQLIFSPSLIISLLILGISVSYFVYLTFYSSRDPAGRGSREVKSYILLSLYLFIPLFGLFLHRVPIEADTLLVSPFLIMVIAVFFNRLFSLSLGRIVVISLIGIIGAFNSYYLLSTEYLTKIDKGSRLTFNERVNAVDSVIRISQGRNFNIVGKGELSFFPAFTMPYEYLLWWKGQPPTKNDTNLKIVVWEKEGEIVVYEEK